MILLSTSDYLPSIAIFLTTAIGGIALWIQTSADDFQNKKKVVRNTGIAILVAGLLSAVASYHSTNQNNKQQQAMQDSIDAGKRTSEQIKILQGLNNEIASKTKAIAENTETITSKTKAIAASTEAIATEGKNLLNKTFK